MWIFLNDRFVRKEDARVSVFDHGFLYGDGVYETIRSYGNTDLYARPAPGTPSELGRRHRTGYSDPTSQWPALLHEAMHRNEVGGKDVDAYIRITVSRGEGEIGLDPASLPACRPWSSSRKLSQR